MSTAVTRRAEVNEVAPVLHLALELSEKTWKLGFTTGLGQKARQRNVHSGDISAVLREVEAARRRFQLPQGVRVVSCYEAGLEGFWLHRALAAHGVENYVVDSSSIDVKRRGRRAKTDRLDTAALVQKLVRYVAGDRKVWSVVRVPPPEAEDMRHNDRELHQLRAARTAIRNSIGGLLKTQGIRLRGRLRCLPEELEGLRLWNDQPLGSELTARLLRMWERLQLIERQITRVEARREELLECDTEAARKAKQLRTLKALGPTISWTLAMEIFAWRSFSNRRELAGLVGLVPTPYQSGTLSRDQGIPKQGRPQLRALLIESHGFGSAGRSRVL